MAGSDDSPYGQCLALSNTHSVDSVTTKTGRYRVKRPRVESLTRVVLQETL